MALVGRMTGKVNYMRKAIRSALLITTAPRAFNNPGWKMDGDKIAVDGDGNPIFVNSAGQEQSVKGDTISNLNNEAKNHRTGKETAEAALNKYRDASGKLIDPEAAFKAIDTVKNIDSKKLIDAGEVDKVRDSIRAEYNAQLSEKDNALKTANETINGMKIASLFDSSEFVRDGIAVPRDMFQATFGNRFKVGEDGKVEAFDASGNRLMSKTNVGEYAKGDEALKLMVEAHPQKDVILKPQQHGGSGNGGNGGQRGQTGRTMKRADFDALDPGAKAQAGAAMAKGEITVVD